MNGDVHRGIGGIVGTVDEYVSVVSELPVPCLIPGRPRLEFAETISTDHEDEVSDVHVGDHAL